MAQKFALSALGDAVRAARRNAGLTQAEAAQLAGVGIAAVRAIERGCGRVRTLTAVMRALRLELRGRGLAAGPVGLALCGARERRYQSRRKLARALGLSRNTLAAIEQGGGLVSALEAYAGALGARLYVAGIGDERSFYTHAGNSSAHHGWETPAELGAALSLAVGGFDLDPCAPSRDARRARVKARLLLTVEDDGLAVPWRGQVFVNPPYGRVLPRWVEKCAAESASARAVVVALLPARPDTRWWHEHVADTADVFMLRGRLRFGDGEQSAPFPSAVVTWGAEQVLLARLASTLPDAWHVPRRATSPNTSSTRG
jgi:phage N-6-adenine-methyltransferase